jgi:hypothetical protein
VSVVRRQGLEPRTRGLRSERVNAASIYWMSASANSAVNDESTCRPMAAGAAYFRGHRALFEHRGRRPVLDLIMRPGERGT